MDEYEYHYILDGHKAIPVDFETWGKWWSTNDRHVALTKIGNSEVSTVFLSLNHNWGYEHEKRPILFETMVFGGDLDGECGRYCTWEEAEAGHAKWCELVQGTIE